MDKYYYTDTIYLQDTNIYYDKDNIKKKVQNYNWHKILSEYGWEKLNLKWIKKLNNLIDFVPRNSLFGVLDCGGEGDCLFHCISYALKSDDVFNINLNYEVSDLRQIICDTIDIEKYNEIIGIYKILKDADDFDEDWDPYEIDFDEFKGILLEGGNNYWGDNIIINILKEKLNINIIILSSNNITNQHNYYPLLYDFDKKLNTIILLYEDNMHFKLVGYFDDYMITLFKNVPQEILKLIKYLR
jgi:hypothetical protein